MKADLACGVSTGGGSRVKRIDENRKTKLKVAENHEEISLARQCLKKKCYLNVMKASLAISIIIKAVCSNVNVARK